MSNKLKLSEYRLQWICLLIALIVGLTGCDRSVPGTVVAQEPPTPTPEIFIPRTMAVPAGAVVSGRVLWGGGPVAGVQVELHAGTEAIAQTTSGNDGVYELEAPPNGGDFVLVALWPDGGANAAPFTPLRVSAGDTAVTADVGLARELVWLEPSNDDEVSTTPTLRWEAELDTDKTQLWIIDAGTTELAFDLTMTDAANGEQVVVLPPLVPGRTYTWDVQSLNKAGGLVARKTGQFRVRAYTGDLPAPCREEGLQTYIDQANGFCFGYPMAFEAQINEASNPVIVGSPLDASPEPVRASLLMEVEVAAEGRTLTEIVDGYLAQFEDMDVPAISRTESTLGGEPAVILEVVPGREGSRDIFMLRDGTLFHLMFMPSVRDFPEAAGDVQLLSVTVVATFSLLPATPAE